MTELQIASSYQFANFILKQRKKHNISDDDTRGLPYTAGKPLPRAHKDKVKIFWHPDQQKWCYIGPNEKFPKIKKKFKKDNEPTLYYYPVLENEFNKLAQKEVAKPKFTGNWLIVSLITGAVCGTLWMSLGLVPFLGVGEISLVALPLILGAATFVSYGLFEILARRWKTGLWPNKSERAQIWRDARDFGFKVLAGALGWTVGSILAPIILPATFGVIGTLAVTSAFIGFCETIAVGVVNVFNEWGKERKPEDGSLLWGTIKLMAAVFVAGATWNAIGSYSGAMTGSIAGELGRSAINGAAIVLEFFCVYKVLDWVGNVFSSIFSRKKSQPKVQLKQAEEGEIELQNKADLVDPRLDHALENKIREIRDVKSVDSPAKNKLYQLMQKWNNKCKSNELTDVNDHELSQIFKDHQDEKDKLRLFEKAFKRFVKREDNQEAAVARKAEFLENTSTILQRVKI